MVTTRHEFLKALHEVLEPKTYLEIGVQYGPSLALAEDCKTAIGIDPFPMVQPENVRDNQVLFPMSSDRFFEARYFVLPPVDLAFIDGMHLVEFVLRDYMNVQRFMSPGGVIVFDDVLPYSDAIATRTQPSGDWTGDVWKAYFILKKHLDPYLVDTSPTGTMVLLNVEPALDMEIPSGDDWLAGWLEEMPVPESILNRSDAVQPETILEKIRD